MPSRPIPMLWAGLIAVLMLLVGLGAGYELPRTSSGTSPTAPASQTLSVIAAGTLGTPFGSLASFLANTTPGVSAPLASQQYEGSLSVMTAVTTLGGAYDVVGSADYHLIPLQLETKWATWEAIFATSPEALVYDPTAAALSGINTTNWPQKVLASGLPLGIANASTDPNGYNEIFVLQLEGLLQNGSTSALYQHFFTTPVGSYAIPNPSTTLVEPESNVASLIASHTIALFITYRSYAVSHALSYVDFAPQVGLGETDASDIAAYAQASTTIQPATGTETVHGSPVLFSVTVPLNAPNATLGLAFVHTVLSPAGSAIMEADGLTPIFPAWCDQIGAAPPWLVPDLSALPASLAVSGAA